MPSPSCKHWFVLERVVSKAGELHHGFLTLVMYYLVENLDFERLLNT